MKMTRTPVIVLGLPYLCFMGYLASSSSQLPERMATHFGAGGQPDGWMSRASYLRFMLVFGLAFPLFAPAMIYAGRFLPDRFFRIPHHDYWFAPARRTETLAYLFRHSLWIAPLMLCFVIGIHFATIQANRLAQPHLSTRLVLALNAVILAGLAIWLVGLIRHFNRAP
jgi:uncharacterized membrane protein